MSHLHQVTTRVRLLTWLAVEETFITNSIRPEVIFMILSHSDVAYGVIQAFFFFFFLNSDIAFLINLERTTQKLPGKKPSDQDVESVRMLTDLCQGLSLPLASPTPVFVVMLLSIAVDVVR